MEEMNRLSRFIENLGRTPIIPLAGFPGISLTGRSMKDNLTDADTQMKTLIALYKEIQPDAMFTMMDLTVEAEFLGCDLRFPEDDSPAVKDHVLKNVEDVESLFDGKTIGGRMPLFAEVVTGLKRELNVPICAYVIGPFTLAGELLELGQVVRAIKKNKERLHRVLPKTADIVTNYASLLALAGADLICILEPSGVMLSPSQFEEFSGNYCKRVFSSGLPTMKVLHICGNTTHLISKMEEVGPDGLSLDSVVHFPQIYDVLKSDTVLIGNLNPVALLMQGTPQKVKSQSEELLKSMRRRKNFILSSGCDIPQSAPIENIRAMMSVRGL
jgi:uroporphyrinogen decarboxylase